VATGVASALTEDDDTNPNRSKGLQGIFGAAGRPPFVMNTAVDEDDVEEEEELGWDDDDEEEEVAEQPRDVDASDLDTPPREEVDEEQIVFKDEALESVTEQLKQAIEERDQLHQTVILQTKEIASLKSSSEASAKEINKLSSELKLKESSAVSAGGPSADSADEETSKSADEIRRLKDLVAAKDMELSNLIAAGKASAEEFSLSAISLTKENEHLRKTNTESLSLLEAEKDEVSALRSEVAALKAELGNTKHSLDSAVADIVRLTSELDEERAKKESPLKESIAKIEEDSRSGTKSHETSDTTSTGVNVEKPTVVSKVLVNDDDDEEGWGDDWD
jgi:uncharacterized phage infection (PIP) family protein YhgE